MNTLRAAGFPEAAVRERARNGPASAFPHVDTYGGVLFGADGPGQGHCDTIDALRLVPPVFVAQRLEKLIDLAREPVYRDVELETVIGGFRSALPVYLSAFGSTQVASADLGIAASRQAGRLGIPMVIGENVVPVNGYRRLSGNDERSLIRRLRAYADELHDGIGGVAIQQSTEDADAEVWNFVYTDPAARSLLESGRLAFELKIGQGAKPGLGGMTVLDAATAGRLDAQFTLDPVFGAGSGRVLRCGTPGTFTEEIMRQNVRLTRNNFPRARVWVKLPPARDLVDAAHVAWGAGADAVTVDGAEGGTGWAPVCFLEHVGLPLGECLARIGDHSSCLLVSGRIWEGARAAKSLALGADAVGLGRAGLVAVDEDPVNGLVNFVDCLAFELRLLISALGKYTPRELGREDLWSPMPAPRMFGCAALAED